jgi:hypothetical protein
MTDPAEFAALKDAIEQAHDRYLLYIPGQCGSLFYRIRELLLQSLLGFLGAKYQNRDYQIRVPLLLLCIDHVPCNNFRMNRRWFIPSSLENKVAVSVYTLFLLDFHAEDLITIAASLNLRLYKPTKRDRVVNEREVFIFESDGTIKE